MLLYCHKNRYFTDYWDILFPFDTFCVHLVHISGFGNMYQEKSGNPVSDPLRKKRCRTRQTQWITQQLDGIRPTRLCRQPYTIVQTSPALFLAFQYFGGPKSSFYLQ
jgi:hypothetical protein